ncbi:lysylphosphatidylglycerol synthase domain-containing protein [Winogradskyella aurantia]|nr:lysylphosphatidylglycerol synthase domain-containing protein [Winogradskyella aurantia]
MPYKTKQFFVVLIKLSIVFGAFYFIFARLSENKGLTLAEFLDALKANQTFSVKHFSILIGLSFTNWTLEILKWKTLVKPITSISFKNALEQSLGGLTASLVTPNRIGDYGAKAMYFEKPYRKKIVLVNLLGHMAQMTVTTLCGVVGLFIFVKRYPVELNYHNINRFFLFLFVLGVFFVFGVRQKRFSIKGFSIGRIINFIKELTLSTHLWNLGLSFLRYLVFSFQFYYLLTLFGTDISYLDAMVVITSMYFLASVVPSITIFDVVIKGSVAIFLFDYIEVNDLSILCITTLMWLLNFALPSFFGSYYVLNFKLPEPQA